MFLFYCLYGLRVFLEDCLLGMLSKLGVFVERSMKKSKTHHTIASAALGGCGGLGQLWEALAEIFDVMFCAPVAQNLSKVSQMHPESMQ